MVCIAGELLVRHIVDNASSGVRFGELLQVLPALSQFQVNHLLRELKRDGRIRVAGNRKAGLWFPAQSSWSANPQKSPITIIVTPENQRLPWPSTLFLALIIAHNR